EREGALFSWTSIDQAARIERQAIGKLAGDKGPCVRRPAAGGLELVEVLLRLGAEVGRGQRGRENGRGIGVHDDRERLIGELVVLVGHADSKGPSAGLLRL